MFFVIFIMVMVIGNNDILKFKLKDIASVHYILIDTGT